MPSRPSTTWPTAVHSWPVRLRDTRTSHGRPPAGSAASSPISRAVSRSGVASSGTSRACAPGIGEPVSR